MARSIIASVEFEERRKKREQEAEEARRVIEAAIRKSAEADRRLHPVECAAEADRRTGELDRRVGLLHTVLARGLRRTARIDLTALRRRVTPPPLDLAATGWPAAPPDPTRYEPARPSPLGWVFGGETRYQRELAGARAEYERARAAYRQAEDDRQARLAAARQRHAARLAEERRAVEEHNRGVDAFAAAVEARDPVAVGRLLRMVLDAVPLPADFPRTASVVSDGERAVVRLELPGPDVVPDVLAVRYDPDDDAFGEVPRPVEEVTELHRLVVDQVALLVLRDLFDADPGLDRVALHGYARGPEVLRLDVDRDTFGRLDLTDPETGVTELMSRLAS